MCPNEEIKSIQSTSLKDLDKNFQQLIWFEKNNLLFVGRLFTIGIKDLQAKF